LSSCHREEYFCNVFSFKDVFFIINWVRGVQILKAGGGGKEEKAVVKGQSRLKETKG